LRGVSAEYRDQSKAAARIFSSPELEANLTTLTVIKTGEDRGPFFYLPLSPPVFLKICRSLVSMTFACRLYPQDNVPSEPITTSPSTLKHLALGGDVVDEASLVETLKAEGKHLTTLKLVGLFHTYPQVKQGLEDFCTKRGIHLTIKVLQEKGGFVYWLWTFHPRGFGPRSHFN
jgi:hypothetical protein